MIEGCIDSDCDARTQVLEKSRGAKGKIAQLGKEELSSIDHKTQTLLVMLFGGIGVADFYRGSYLQGLAKLTTVSFLGALFYPLMAIIVPVVNLVSLISLAKGTYTDGEGKFIRSVVQLKKEEMSACDQITALLFCQFLGVLGVHQFYAGKPFKGILMLCTLGGFGIWYVINVYQLAIGSFRDGKGKVICPDYMKQSI